MNINPSVWYGTPREKRQCIHEDEKGKRCLVVFTPSRSDPVNLRRCPKHRGRLKASADIVGKKRRRKS